MPDADPDVRYFVLSVWPDASGRPVDNFDKIEAYLVNDGWRIDCCETLLADPAGPACHLLLRLARGTTTDSVAKYFVLRVWRKAGGRPEDNLKDLAGQLSNGWCVQSFEPLLTHVPRGLCYVLYRLERPRATAPDPERKPFVLKVWLDGGEPRNNLSELAGEQANGWRVHCSERLLAAPAEGLCYTLLQLDRAKAPVPVVIDQRR